MSDNQVLIGLASIVMLGIGAQSIARRRDFPSLLLLLPAGLLAGNTGLVDPEELFGETLFPGVTLLVGLLLFQSGLQLRHTDLPREATRPVRRLTIVGVMVTFAGGTAAVALTFRPVASLAWLAGAILVVSGPTVVGPLLRIVRPREPTDSILRWEGTILDPVGAILGVVVFNLILASERVGLHPVLQMASRLALGAVVGAVFGALLVFLMSRFLITDNMEAAVALLFAVGAFTVAELVLSEAGLFAAVILGIVAANQRIVPTSRISGFGETLEVLIIGSLFIVLGALVDIDDLIDRAWQIAALVAILVFAVRPVSVVLSMLRSSLGWRDRAMIGWVDPRGVVAAATAAAFAGPLSSAGLDSDFLLPTVFGVILGTGVIYGLTARPMSSLLKVRRAPARGVVIMGDDRWMADMAGCLKQAGVPVLVISSDPEVRLEDRSVGVETVSILDAETDLKERIEEMGAAKALVNVNRGITQNLVLALLTERLGRRHVYRVIKADETSIERTLEKAATARAFGPEVTDADVHSRIDGGASIHTLAEDASPGESDLVLASVREDGWVDLQPTTAEVVRGETLVVLS